ncbi:hypothetical protein [Streptomyces sp. Pv4-95]|uniref:LmrA/YxaF family transcription factor n=1 Tax=Streptomyces sp. Pv4-95 TaxID=3049543 RepID=UPI003891FC94
MTSSPVRSRPLREPPTLWRRSTPSSRCGGIELIKSHFRSCCPIESVAVEANDDAPQLARSAAAVFARPREGLAALLLRHRLPEEQGKRLSAFIIASVEGTVIMCRRSRASLRLRPSRPKPMTSCHALCLTGPRPVTRHGRDRLPIHHPRILRSRNAHA